MKTFISFSSHDQSMADEIVELLRLHYIDFFYSPRSMRGSYFRPQIVENLQQAKMFLVLLSPAAIASQWVRWEVEQAMALPELYGKVYPILIEPTPDWTSLHEHLGRLQLFDLVNDRERALTRLLEEEYHTPRHRHDFYRVGDVLIQVLIFAGGNGRTRYRDGDIVCDGPKETRTYVAADDIQLGLPDRIAQLEAMAADKGQTLFNGKQVRLCDYRYGGPNATGGTSDKPLELRLGWTEYFYTRLTNGDRQFKLPCGQSILQKYGPDLEDLAGSGLSNPMAVNMSVVTSDRKIYLSTRSKMVSWNPEQLQPAVSGDGQPEDLDENGIYDPFRTAIREAQEECVGAYPIERDQVTFFGLARTMGTQFPFLFGEIRLPVTSKHLQGYPPLSPFEGQPFAIDFTVEAVCDWVRKHHLDHFDGRRGGVIGTTLFSLLQSMHYEYPDRWSEVMERLSDPAAKHRAENNCRNS